MHIFIYIYVLHIIVVIIYVGMKYNDWKVPCNLYDNQMIWNQLDGKATIGNGVGQ